MLRLQIPVSWMKPIITLHSKILSLNNPILSPACLLTLEKILYNADTDFLKEITDVINVDQFYLNIFGSLMNILGQSKDIFAIKCFLKICLITNIDNLRQITNELSISINNLLKMILPDTSEEQFNSSLFEVIALIMKKFSHADPGLQYFNNFFDAIKSNFLTVLDNNITDLLGYIFQILNLHIETVKTDNFIHQSMFTTLLTCEGNWAIPMRFLYPAYIKYIDSCLKILQNNISIETFNSIMLIVFKVKFYIEHA